MRDYTFHIHDDRYSVPTLTFVIVADDARARALALRRLDESAHHRAVDVFDGGKLLFRVP